MGTYSLLRSSLASRSRSRSVIASMRSIRSGLSYSITKLGYVTQLGEHGKKGTNKVTIRFLEDEHPIPKKWIERVGDEVDYVDTIARVMVDDAAELPSSPLPKRSSPLKRLQSRIGLPKRTRARNAKT